MPNGPHSWGEGITWGGGHQWGEAAPDPYTAEAPVATAFTADPAPLDPGYV